MLFSSLHLKCMIHWAVLARFSCAVLRITAEIAQSEELKNAMSLITKQQQKQLVSSHQCHQVHNARKTAACCCGIFYNDISLMSTEICQWLFIKSRCNIRFLQDASVNHEVSKRGSSCGKSCLPLNEKVGVERGKGRRFCGNLNSSKPLQICPFLRHRKRTSQAD